MASRLSHYSTGSGLGQSRTNTMQNPMQSSAQVSTTTLLNALHNAYSSGQPYPLEPSTSLVVNTWVSASQTGADGRVGGTVDVELARRSWEHARRRAEDSAIVLGYVMDKPASSQKYTNIISDRSTDQHLRFLRLSSLLCRSPCPELSTQLLTH
jgi:hypothetical protein